MDRKPDSTEAREARRKYTEAFDNTLLGMWEEKQYKLFGKRHTSGRYKRRTGELIRSTTSLRFKSDAEAISVEFEEQFREYGIYVDAGTGGEVARGNPGDIGLAEKRRKAKPWFKRKYYLSVMNLRDFYAENLALQTVDIVAEALNDKSLRKNIVRVGGPATRFTMNNSVIPGANLPN